MQEVNLKLVPYHHIEIDNTGAFKGMSSKKQSLVLIDLGNEDDKFYDSSDSSVTKSQDVASALDKVKSIF